MELTNHEKIKILEIAMHIAGTIQEYPTQKDFKQLYKDIIKLLKDK